VTGRRTLIGALAGGLLAVRFAGHAQTPGRVYRIGLISGNNPFTANTPIAGAAREAFFEGMRERGWIEGQHFIVENLYSDGRNERIPALAAELVQRKVDLIITGGSPATAAARNATTTIPIVFYFVGDPLGSGFVASLARPGGNVTGLGGLGPGMSAKHVEFLKELIPKASRFAIFINSTFPVHAAVRAEVEPAARSVGVTLLPVELGSPADIDAAFATAARERVDALLIFGQPFMFSQAERVARLALEQRLPAMIPFEEVTRAGLLMSYGWRVTDDLRRVSYYIDRILKGARPADLPIEQPTRFRLVINMNTAKTLGIAIPQSLLLRADEVIE
jgi:putative ABC transport system substrate-binding protein